MRLFLLRHGQSIGDIEGRFGGSYDDDLTSKGRNQVKLLALKLRDKEITQIYTSFLRRAKQTSDILANILNSEVVQLKGLSERDYYGVLSGLTIDEAKQKFPNEIKKINYKLMDSGIKGQEQYSDFKNRTIKTFNSIIKEQLNIEAGINAKSKEKVIGIVTHSGPIRCIFREFLKLGEFEEINDCAIIELNCKRRSINIISMENAKLA